MSSRLDCFCRKPLHRFSAISSSQKCGQVLHKLLPQIIRVDSSKSALFHTVPITCFGWIDNKKTEIVIYIKYFFYIIGIYLLMIYILLRNFCKRFSKWIVNFLPFILSKFGNYTKYLQSSFYHYLLCEHLSK